MIKRLQELKGSRTIADMARDLGVNHPRLSRYFRGESVPSSEMLILLSKKENVNLQWLLTGEGDPYLPPGWEKDMPEASPSMAIPIIATISKGPDGTVFWKEDRECGIELIDAVAVRAEDEAMEELAFPGQHVVLIPEAKLHDGDFAILKIRRKGFFFRRVYFKPKSRVELQGVSVVKAEPTLTVAEKDILKHYRVVGMLTFKEGYF